MHRALPKLRTLVTLALMTGVVSMVAATTIDDRRSIRGGEARAVAEAAGPEARVDPAPGTKGTTGTGIGTGIGIGTDTEPEAIALAITPRRDGTLRFDLDRLAELRIGAVVEISLGDAGVDRYEVLDARRERGSDRWWRLASIDHADGVGTLAASGRMLAGWLQSPAFGGDFEWSLRPAGPGRLQPMPKPADAVGCGGGIEPPAHLLEPEANRGMGPFEERGRAPIARLGDDEVEEECAGCSSGVADLAFFFTPQVLEKVEDDLADLGEDPEGALDAITAMCNLESANTTQAMENSDLRFGVRRVYVGLVDWLNEESGDILGKFASPEDGEMDEIHEIRDEVGADACSLITLSDGGAGYCGVAYLGNGNSPGAAFNNLIWGCMGFTLLAHEFGHNIGCCHAAGDGGGCDEPTGCDPWGGPLGADCCRPDPTGPDTDAPRFAVGWRWVNPAQVPACRRTLMAYGPGTASLNYSNPDVQLAGVATGSPEDDPGGRWADNARVIRLTMPGTAGYRCEVAQPADDSGRLVAGNLGEFDRFGKTLATNGLGIFVGAARHDSQGQNSGAVYRFSDDLEDDPDLGFLQSGKFSPTDLSEGERFGESVSAWEDVLVIGAPYAPRNVIEIDEDTGEEVIVESFPLAGRAEVWVDDGTGYCRIQVLQPEELAANDLFGTAVAVAGDLLAVGAPLREGGTGAGIVDAGVVYVYQREASGQYVLLETYEGDVAGHRLGETLAMGMLTEGNESDQMMLMGSPEWSDQRGAVQPVIYFRLNDDFIPSLDGRLTGSLVGDRFGDAVAMFDGQAVIGAPLSRGTRGSARVYRSVGAGLELVEQLVPTGGGQVGDRFGASVACSGVRVAIGTPDADVMDGDDILVDDAGGVFIYERDGSGWRLASFERPLGLEPGDRYGTSVAIAGTVLFSGAPDADDAGILSGVVYAEYLQFEDCNENLVDDSLDIFLGTSTDANLDGIPDECNVGSCLADLNGDGVVNGYDLGLFFISWGECPAEPGCPGDLDFDGLVEGSDLGLFFLAWGQLCEDPEP